MTALLEIRDGARHFGGGGEPEVRALDGVSAAVARGACALVLGPSGSGKTTLLALLGGLDRPTAGAVLVDGADPWGVSEGARSRLRRRFGYAFPGGPMIPRLRLWENVTLGLVPRGMRGGERRARAADLLARVGLADRLGAAPEGLSTGELQRAVLARALAGDPEILLADEPLANLDAVAAGTVAGVLEAFHRAGGTLVVATHDGAAFPFASERIRLERGRRLPA